MTKSKHNKQHKKGKIPTELAYKGPLKPISANHQVSTFKKFGTWIVAATTNGAGVLNQAYVVSPSTLNDWGNLQNDWSEYRILAFEVEYIPNFENGPSPTSAALGGLQMAVIDRTSSTTALSSTSQALEFEGCQVAAVNKRLKVTAKATGANELAWVNITTSSYWASVRYYSTVLTTSQNYGNYLVSILVEFRSAL